MKQLRIVLKKNFMRIALVTHGTRGDAQPFAALGLALMARGHEVTLAVPPNLVSFVETCGVKAGKIAIDSQAFMESDEGGNGSRPATSRPS